MIKRRDLIMKIFLCLVTCVMLNSCTYSISMVHTTGQATDVLDAVQTNTPSTSLAIPSSPVLI